MNYKIALVHDWLVFIGGAEKVLEAIYELYPAPIYTLVKDKNSQVQAINHDYKSLINQLNQELEIRGW